MKGRAEIEKAVSAFFARHELEELAGMAAWPQRIPLGRPTKAELAAQTRAIARMVDELAGWARTAPVKLVFERRMSGGALHEIPTHAIVETVDDSARLSGRAAERTLKRDRERARLLRARLAVSGEALLKALRATRDYSEVDFGLLVEAACWFRENDACGLTPRQVPLPGFSAKWIDSPGRRGVIATLSGKELHLLDRKQSVEFAYLDPGYLAAGGRRYDSHVVGDVSVLPYDPDFVIVVENKDTFRGFPPRTRGICLFGSGWAGTSAIPAVPWIHDARKIYYWGDIDADGYEILNAYRSSGLDVRSVLMDAATYEAYERFGTDYATGESSLASRREKPLEHLTGRERAVYKMLVSPDCPGHRRIEQERIPFTELPI